MSSDALLPDLDDVPDDQPASSKSDTAADPLKNADPNGEHATGDEQAEENQDREPPA